MKATALLTNLRGGLAGAVVVALVLALLLAACGESASDSEEFTSEWPDDRPLPTATVEAVDTDSGVTIQIELSNFVISSPAAEDADGHLHVAVDGAAAQMTFDTDVHLGELTPGTHEVHVGFVSNDHSTITADGAHVASMVVLEIAPDGSVVEVRPAPAM